MSSEADESAEALVRDLRKFRPGDTLARIWPSGELRNISADARELAASAAKSFREALNKDSQS